MAKTVTYSATMAARVVSETSNYRSSRAWQGFQRYADQNMAGLVAFPSMNMAGKIINKVSLRVTTDASGRHDKTAYLYQATAQATAARTFDDTITGRAYVGTAIGSFRNDMYNNTTTNVLDGTTLTNMAAYLQAGNNTFVLFENNPQQSPYGQHSVNFMVWTACTITIEYEEGASVPTVSASAVDMGTSVTISTNRQNTGSTHTLTYTFGDATGTIATGVTETQAWTPPLSLAAQVPSATNGVCTITCETFYNGDPVGRKTCALTLNVPSSVVPTITGVTHEEGVSSVASKNIGAYVQNKSRPAVTISATGAQGSTISSYRTVLDGITYTAQSFTASKALTSYGNITMTVTVYDTRGRTASRSYTLTALKYSEPAITGFTAERCSEDGTEAKGDGTRVRITASASVSPLDNKNTIAAKVYRKLHSDSAYSQDMSLTTTGYSLSVTDQRLEGTYATGNTYDLKLSVTDLFGTRDLVISVGTKSVIMDFRSSGDGVAFGKMSETANTAEFAWPLKLNTPLGIDQGGTGETTASAALAALGGNDASNITTGTLGAGRLPFKVAYGRVTVTDAAGMAISYSSAGFTAQPMIALGYWTSGSNTTLPDYAPRVVNVTATGATICGKTNWTVAWIAIGV